MISIVSKPTKFTPAGNPVIWQVKTDNTNIVYFKVVLYDDDTTSVINQLNMFTTPATPMGSYINLSRLLDNTVRWELNNDSQRLVVPMVKTVKSYRLKVTEFNLDPTTSTVVSGHTYDTDLEKYYTWNGDLGRITAQNFVQAQWVVNKDTKANFLTNKPNMVKVNDYTFEQLYFLHDGSVDSLKARIRTYDSSGILLDTILDNITDLGTYQMYRLNISPKALSDSNNVDFTNVHYYVVDLVDSTLTSKTNERVYFYTEAECWMDFINVLWVNPYGGIDSYQMVAPQDTLNMAKVVQKRNILGVNSEGVYDDINDNIFNPSEVLINNTPTTSTKMWTRELSDREAYWLQGLFSSKQVFVEITDMSIVPALLQESTYQINRQKYNRGTLNVVPITLQMAEGVIPTGIHAYSSKVASIQFIDSQMNTIENNLPGFNIITDPVSGRQYNPDEYTTNYA